MRAELKYKFRVAVLKHVDNEKRGRKVSEARDSDGAGGMSFFTAARQAEFIHPQFVYVNI
jgi:hypothetical protein